MTSTTASPWTAHLIGNQWEPRIHSDATGELLAVVGNADDDPGVREEWEANANLMAAAPEMLEALKAILSHPRSTDNNCVVFMPHEIAKARAAIAKAEGTQ